MVWVCEEFGGGRQAFGRDLVCVVLACVAEKDDPCRGRYCRVCKGGRAWQVALEIESAAMEGAVRVL